MPTNESADRIVMLFMKKQAGVQLEPEEEAELESWLKNNRKDPVSLEEFENWHTVGRNMAKFEQVAKFSEDVELELPVKQKGVLRRLNGYWFAAASILAVVVSMIIYNSLTKTDSRKSELAGGVIESKDLVLPAKQRALLTVAGGSTYELDSLKDGQVVDGAMKEANGSLQYLKDADKVNLVEHRISTPAKGFYNLVMSDGTHVWLNASSEIAFIPVFGKNERRVKLNGEAYFQVSKEKDRPFIVQTKIGNIKVYGTSFNVKSYDQEALAATLEEGSVNVENATSKESRKLKPGNQVVIEPVSGALKFIEKADLESVTAWKNGVFAFDKIDLVQVIRELERWYGVKAIYDPSQLPKSVSLYGKLDRSLSLNELARVLSRMAAVHMTVTENNTLLVQP